jgi:hypothetical protein
MDGRRTTSNFNYPRDIPSSLVLGTLTTDYTDYTDEGELRL